MVQIEQRETDKRWIVIIDGYTIGGSFTTDGNARRYAAYRVKPPVHSKRTATPNANLDEIDLWAERTYGTHVHERSRQVCERSKRTAKKTGKPKKIAHWRVFEVAFYRKYGIR